ncbi:MAG: aldo/keto reductase [Deltaproteobacteria bacterium]|nr:MAG: aldo/keto reductase [Deltaproteobacteria bacterium]
MEYRKMGRTGLKVSSFCLGTMMFGRQVEENLSIRIIQTALDAGVNFIDTADMYVNGVTEEIVGKAIKKKRDQIVLASKGGHVRQLGKRWGDQKDSGPIDLARPRPFHAWPGHEDVGPNDMGLSRKHLMQALERSLKRLDTDYLDIYYAHMPDYDTPLEETLRAMDDMVHQGKVRYLACSNFRAFQLCKSLWLSDKYNLARWDCIQPPYNLLTRDIEYELLPLCMEEGIGVCVFSPMAAGFLTGKYEKEKGPIEGARFSLAHQGYRYNQPYWNNSNFAAVEQFKKIAEEHGKILSQFALAWVLSNKAITAIVCGATSIEQLQENMAATEITLSQKELDACDEVWHQLRPPRLFYGR